MIHKRSDYIYRKKDEFGNLYNLYLKKEINSDDFQITYAKKGVLKKEIIFQY